MTCTDSGFSDSCCTLHTVLWVLGVVAGGGCIVGFGSGVVDRETLINEARDKRFTDFPPTRSLSGGVEKKEDLRCATIEDAPSGVRIGLRDAVESLLDFSARALILWDMPDPTLIFLAATTAVSVFEWVNHGPDNLRGPDGSEETPPRRGSCCDADLLGTTTSGLDVFRGKKGIMGDLETDIGMASSSFALCNSSMKESSDR